MMSGNLFQFDDYPQHSQQQQQQQSISIDPNAVGGKISCLDLYKM